MKEPSQLIDDNSIQLTDNQLMITKSRNEEHETQQFIQKTIHALPADDAVDSTPRPSLYLVDDI